MQRTITLLLVSLFAMPLLFAQTPKCGHQHATQHLAQKHPQYEKLVQQTFEQAQLQTQQAQSRSQEILTVPVVVHVVYNTPEQNVSDELIQSQLQVLNEDFQRTNPDAEDGREMYKAIAGNANIRFVLAETDPDGNPTTGITRTQTEVSTFMDIGGLDAILEAIDSCGFDIASTEGTECLLNVLLGGEENAEAGGGLQLDQVKSKATGGQDPWDTEHYINIWVCNLNIELVGQETPAIMGFAYPPVGAPNWPAEGLPTDLKDIDGIVIHHQAFGVNNPNAGLVEGIFKKGRTCTHEMGHYFGLRHISGDGDCASDDGIRDTPAEVATQNPELNPDVICSNLHTLDTCPEDELPDMIENFMSYNPEACQNLFTVEQVGIMRAMLEGPRSGLLMNQTTTSTFSTELNQALNIYPNPANSQLTIQLEGYDLADFQVSVQTILGQQVLTRVARPSLDISQLDAGIYFLRLRGGEQEVTRKISVIRP